jgi:hypothetical protein
LTKAIYENLGPVSSGLSRLHTHTHTHTLLVECVIIRQNFYLFTTNTQADGSALGQTWGALVWEAYSLGADGVICFAVVPLLTYLYVGGGDAAYQAMLRESARARASERVCSKYFIA